MTGRNAQGQLGLNDKVARLIWTQVGSGTDWAEVACGWQSTIARKSDGSIYGTGDNLYGQLGLGDNTDRDEFTLISGMTCKQVACGRAHAAVILSDDTLWTCGRNNRGQLGEGNTTSTNAFSQINDSIPKDGIEDTWTKIRCGEYHSMAIKIVEPVTLLDSFDEPQVWPM